MKKLTLLLLTFISFSVHAQIPKEAFDLTNSLSGLCSKENPEEAIKASIRLNEIYKPFFTSNIHTQLSQGLLRTAGDGNQSNFLNKLYAKKIKAINDVIEPAYLWNTSFKITTNDKANTLLKTYYSKLPDSTNYNSKVALYGLLIIKEFNKKEIGSSENKDKILAKIVANISTNSLINKSVEGSRDTKEERAHYRFLLAYNYILLFDKNHTETALKSAYKYSPDQTDLQNLSGYFYDAHLLIDGPNNMDYKKRYFHYLNENGKEKEALNILLSEAYMQPNDTNLNELKSFYNKKNTTKSFESIWSSYLNSKMEDVPAIKIEFESGTLDLSKKRDNWVYIDVWGTWCSPCVKELPEFNKVSEEFNKNPNSKIKFYTFSYASQKLKEFMTKNNYTFPVAEIDKETTKLFKVSGYPTKILISPDNKYLKIPFGANWQEYFKNYCLIQ